MENEPIEIIAEWNEFDSTNLAMTATHLEEINSKLDILVESDKLFMTYGYIYIPLFMIVFMAWWVMKQFIYKN
ncbi:hypothetical protein [Schinkia azotoformans]|nr:hypothetical protein [Schinkia azotoformans]MEC1715003.1 hypothetical protein [Schinkia azotoformans]MEC1740237.1 hypothetical protein [Schinkia azotoformans]MEC1747146.1 hypothetical protein [Schinkia azotoformans]MEC1785334.1 hypothetical protein [Schinkia azotoformans]MED4376205.1 hypothetical protein [Schinkia azotoformans]